MANIIERHKDQTASRLVRESISRARNSGGPTPPMPAPVPGYLKPRTSDERPRPDTIKKAKPTKMALPKR
ncbi:MAG TPA: hypothetical protein VGX03_17970 [Candidatus Binatia bacterium]|jgi:hypothetical protein|nr:hypothetical protein [Candidatus Binatia bacterium]